MFSVTLNKFRFPACILTKSHPFARDNIAAKFFEHTVSALIYHPHEIRKAASGVLRQGGFLAAGALSESAASEIGWCTPPEVSRRLAFTPAPVRCRRCPGVNAGGSYLFTRETRVYMTTGPRSASPRVQSPAAQVRARQTGDAVTTRPALLRLRPPCHSFLCHHSGLPLVLSNSLLAVFFSALGPCGRDVKRDHERERN